MNEMVNALRIERRRAALHAVDGVALRQKKLGEMGAVLPGPPLGPPNHCCLRARSRGKFVCIQNSLAPRGRAKSLVNAGSSRRLGAMQIGTPPASGSPDHRPVGVTAPLPPLCPPLPRSIGKMVH